MKYIDAEELKRSYAPLEGCLDVRTLDGAKKIFDAFVDLTPAADVVEMTLENAIDYLHSIGWMQEHDRQMMEMGEEGDEVSE